MNDIEFSKTDIQRQAIKLLASDAIHCLLYGGSRSGKTFIAIYALIVRACKTKSRHIVLRKTFNSIKTSIWMDTIPKVMSIAFPLLPYHPNKSDYFLSFPNGSELWVAGLDEQERVEKILGKEYSTIYFNEISQLDYYQVQIALTRLAEKNNLSKKVYYDCNPPSKKHWSYWLFMKKVNPIESDQLVKPQNYVSMLMNPKDNMENLDEEYLALLKSLPEKERNRFLEGKFNDADDGLVYYSFDQEKHIGKTKISNGTLLIGRDFNVNPMTSVVFQYEDNHFYIHDEVFQNNSDTYKMDTALIKKGYVGNVIPDSTCKNRKTSGKSDLQIMKSHGFTIMNTRNPYVVDRVNNANRIFLENRITINPKCKKLINDLNKVSWENGKLSEGKDKMLTHISDALTYGLWKIEPIVKGVRQLTISSTM